MWCEAKPGCMWVIRADVGCVHCQGVSAICLLSAGAVPAAGRRWCRPGSRLAARPRRPPPGGLLGAGLPMISPRRAGLYAEYRLTGVTHAETDLWHEPEPGRLRRRARRRPGLERAERRAVPVVVRPGGATGLALYGR